MDPQSLASNLRELGRLLNGKRARAIIEVAQTARREANSGLVSSLKESERAEPERKEREQAPRPRSGQSHQEDDKRRGASERDEPKPAPLRLAPRSDIRDDGDDLAPR